MSNVMTTAVRRERSIQVRPRRRGATAPTTVEVAPVPLIAPVVQTVQSPEAPTPDEAPRANPIVVSPVHQHRLTFEERQQYESLASAVLSRAASERGLSMAIFSASADVDCVEIVARLANIVRERGSVRVTVANEVFPFRDAGIVASLDHADATETRQALEVRLRKMRSAGDFLLCAGGVASSPLAEIVGTSCDAGYLAIKLGQTDSAAARGALADLHRRGIRVVGCIAVS